MPTEKSSFTPAELAEQAARWEIHKDAKIRMRDGDREKLMAAIQEDAWFTVDKPFVNRTAEGLFFTIRTDVMKNGKMVFFHLDVFIPDNGIKAVEEPEVEESPVLEESPSE